MCIRDRIEITLFFEKNMTIEYCHNICDEVEEKIKEQLGNCSISIHAEPICEKCAAKKLK